MNTNELEKEELDARLTVLELLVARLLAAQSHNPQFNPTALQEAMQIQTLNITQAPRQVPQDVTAEDWALMVLRIEVSYTKYIDKIFQKVRIAGQHLKES